ncbi:hypothetical protein L596_001573 [Steinernema carpocapsae]|uniref:Uncharacterized protein n=1 Tax=Steinernema carpocapsae TaxID=34508 RepID=A0A4U8ULL7_STECR|nr:hypothetical protein L596_001573 [Steinernema carpocapsae]
MATSARLLSEGEQPHADEILGADSDQLQKSRRRDFSQNRVEFFEFLRVNAIPNAFLRVSAHFARKT